ncbi:MAG: hypothetical protein Q9191_001584 [Dirinaria sp. TL-2023a]
MFNFIPLLGSHSSSDASQSLLEFEGGIKVLIDVGWGNGFEVVELERLKRHVPSLSIILLTHATPSHLAAYAHCCKHFPQFTQIPTYATTPVISLGRTLLQDIYASTPLASTIIPQDSLLGASYSYQPSAAENSLNILLQPPSYDEIGQYFARIHPLKYSQPHQPLPSPFSPPLNGLTVTAYSAGHTLGGTIWHLQHGMESVVYAVDWNQVRENVFSGAAWLGGSGAEVIEQLRKPTAMVCSAKGAERSPLAGGRKKRDDLLIDMISTALGKGGVVLIPTDTSARVLELAYLLEHAWRQAWRKEAPDGNRDSALRASKLYLASKNAGATMTYARSMLEWMDESVVREFESESSNFNSQQQQQHKRTNSKQLPDGNRSQAGKPSGPFDFQYLKMLERRSQVERAVLAKGPSVILASDTSLQWGFSKDILRRIAGEPSNLVVLTNQSNGTNDYKEAGSSIIGTLWQWYHERQDGIAVETIPGGQTIEQVYTGGRELSLQISDRIPLEGKELLMYQQYLATQRRLQNTVPASNGNALETAADALDETSSTSSSSSEESDPERQGKALNTSAVVAHFNRNKLGQAREDVGVNALLRRPGVYDYYVRGKKGREQMYPFLSKRRRGDDFGELINPDDYLRAEERDDIDGQGLRDNEPGKETKLGQKRKWQESGLQNGTDRRGSSGSNKRRQITLDPRRRPTTDASNGDGGAKDETINYEDPSSGSEDEAEDSPTGPSKVKTETITIQIHLRIGFVDFSGIHDQRSLSMLIPLIQPKKLILVAGTLSETRYLADDCRQKLNAQSKEAVTETLVYTPTDGELINASVDTNAWTVKLSEALVRRFHWQDVKGMGVVTLVGQLAATTVGDVLQTEAARKKQKLAKQETVSSLVEEAPPSPAKPAELVPVLDVLPANMAAATRSVAQPLHVGDLRLADLRKILQSAGHTAEFRGEGTLLIDGLVAVRKSGTGKIEVEGGGLSFPDLRTRASEGSFFAVKRMIYEGLAVIAGG